MKRFLIMALTLTMHNAWADIRIQVVDNKYQAIPNAIISLPGYARTTPKTVAVMEQVHNEFSPRVLVIEKGQSVRFPNNDNIRHHVYSFSKPKTFEIKLYKGADPDPIVFDKPGLVIVGCNIHDDMIGYIYVADNEFAIKTDHNGYATLPAQAGDTITIWQEDIATTINSKKTMILGAADKQRIELYKLP